MALILVNLIKMLVMKTKSKYQKQREKGSSFDKSLIQLGWHLFVKVSPKN